MAAESGLSSAARNHPFRLEVQDVTPVSASLLWSLRPPPLSAIPRNLFRHPKQARPSMHHQASASNASSTSSSSQLPRNQANRLANEAGVTATRSVNRKVTKVSLRNVSPSKRSRIIKQQQTASHGIDSEEWPSDDGATAVDEDEMRDDDEADQEKTLDEDPTRQHADDHSAPSETSEDGLGAARIFESDVSVCVNGVPWSQVVMGDRGADEAFIVVYGLLPSREYQLMLSVQGKPSALLALATTAEHEEKQGAQLETPHAGTSVTRPAQVGLRTHTPPMQDTEASPLEGSAEQGGGMPISSTASASSALVAGAATTAAIQASIRRARKDASRAESALRGEIEAIKRGLERMSDVDHRSKQKVLALQESIRQATLHAKDIHEEAIFVEGERESWDAKEREREDELSEVRAAVEDNLRMGDGRIKQDEEEVEAMEKELQKVSRALDERWAARERLEKEKVVEVEQEMQRVQREIESLLRPSAMHQHANYSPYSTAPLMYPLGQTATSFAPSQGTSRGSKTRGPARGGHRSVSNPAMGGSSRKNQNRLRPQGQASHSYAADETMSELHGSSSSSTHGSLLNPHNPEFVPSNASPVVNKSLMLPHVDYSPSTSSRFAYASPPLHKMEHSEFERRGSLGPTGLSPHANTVALAPPGLPWSVASPNATGTGPSPWPKANVTASPPLSHDIWGAPASSTASPPRQHGLHTKTSVPFGLNASLLRGSPSFAQGTARTDDLKPFLHVPYEDEARGASAPVSPSHPSSHTFARRHEE